jgi:hypothetical protein
MGKRALIVPTLMAVALAIAGAVYLTQPAPVRTAPTPTAGLCGSSTIVLQIAPVLPTAQFPQGDAAADCFMWQTFIYLNWPALADSPGHPDPNAQFGSAAPVVWNTYKRSDQVFLPNAQTPAPWNQPALVSHAPATLRPLIASGGVRVLTQTAKMTSEFANIISTTLTITDEVFGGPLVDQAGDLAYYEMLINEIEYNYIVGNQLYNADIQYEFARTQGISLPNDSIEIKAAWKVLTPSELAARPVRFYTTQALLPGSNKPVVVGLVGLHIMQMVPNTYQGFWATFGQIDNAPLQGAPADGAYSFYNPHCIECAVNKVTIPPTPTQMLQVIAIPHEAARVNSYMRQLIASTDGNSPWQFYQLLNTQWPQFAQDVGLPGMRAPLPIGNPNVTMLLNPVLETFVQPQPLKVVPHSCITCHRYAAVAPTAANPKPRYATSYSFLFHHAAQPPAK